MKKNFLTAVMGSALVVGTVSFCPTALAAGALSIGPYASVSSSKAIKPKVKEANTAEETTTQRTTYGVKVDLRLSKLFTLGVNVGTNKVDTTKKASAMRDEFGEIDYEKDLNVDPNNQGGEYRYQEEQRLGTAQLIINPALWPGKIWIKAGAGVRARQRLLSIEDTATDKSEKLTDKIRYHALATAGLQLRLLRAISAGIEYKFYFIKAPELEPHEQEALVTFGLQI
jgi:hypothetical protein